MFSEPQQETCENSCRPYKYNVRVLFMYAAPKPTA